MAQGPALRRPLTLWRRLDTASRWAFPGFMLVFGLILIGMPFGLPNQAALRPVYAMACVYFWSLYRPAALPTPLVALCGVLLDLLGLSPPGLWAVILLVLQFVTLVARRRLAPARFIVTWGAFIGFAIAAAGLQPADVPIRGGTDGATLSFKGLPCPNLGTGGFNCHGPFECATVEKMDQMVDILLHIVDLYKD